MTAASRTRFARSAALVALTAISAYLLQLFDTHLKYPDRNFADEIWRQARYFTYLTTVIVAGSFTATAVRGRVSPGWAAGLCFWSLAIGLVYHGLLARDLTGLSWLADHAMHTLVPAVVLAWWLCFAPKGRLRPAHAAMWLSWPALYAVLILVRGEIDGRHPYFFIDPPLIGWPKVILWCACLAMALWLSGLALVALARRIS